MSITSRWMHAYLRSTSTVDYEILTYLTPPNISGGEGIIPAEHGRARTCPFARERDNLCVRVPNTAAWAHTGGSSCRDPAGGAPRTGVVTLIKDIGLPDSPLIDSRFPVFLPPPIPSLPA